MVRQFFTFLILLTLSSDLCTAQNARTKNWVLGDSVLINFNVDPPNVEESSLDSFEGFSVISDTVGELLFYTNGVTVWNSSHNIMPNGEGLNSAPSATNAALIVPKPSNDDIYYIFTVGEYGGNQGGFGGIAYSVVDMSLEGGLGDVVEKNTILHTQSTEKLCGTFHENGVDYWIMSHDFGNDQFRCFLLTQDGVISSPVISKVGAIHKEFSENDWGSRATGSMRFSPSGCKLALVLAGAQSDTIQLFNFDKLSGYVYGTINLRSQYGIHKPYLLCFSSDGSKLYTTMSKKITQFDLTTFEESAIQQTYETIAIHDYPGIEGSFQDLQIAPNGKIYISRMWTNVLSSIESPNNLGSSSNFVDTAFVFPSGRCEYGLPNYVSNFLITDQTPDVTCAYYCPDLNLGEDQSICAGDTLTINLVVPQGNVTWNDGSTDFIYPITDEGNYIASYAFYNCPIKTDTLNIQVINNNVTALQDTTVCLDEPFTLTLPISTNTTYNWSNDITGHTFLTQFEGEYELETQNLGCSFYDTFLVTDFCAPLPQIEIPNVFTPNNDGVNDLFKPANIENIQKLEISIYNRWGELMFHQSGSHFSWDGYFNSSRCSSGQYYYILKYTNLSNKNRSLKGTVTLLY